MAITKTIEIKADAKGAEKELKILNEQLEIQRSVLIDLEKQLIKVEKAQKETNQTDLAAQKILADKAAAIKNELKLEKIALKELNLEKRQAASATQELNTATKDLNTDTANSTKIIKLLDSFTGGYLGTVKKFYEGTIESVKALKLFSLSLKGLSKALIATGIGALVVALGAIVAYWDDIKGLVSGVSSEQEELNALAQKNVDIEQKKFDSISDQENILKLQGKSEKEILQLKQAQLEEVIAATEAQIEQNKITLKAQIEASRRNKEILSGILKFISIPITAVLAGIDQIGKALGKDFGLMEGFDSIANFVFDPEQVEEEGNMAIEEQQVALDKLKNQRAGFQLQLNKIDENAAAKRREKNQKEIDANAARQKQEFEERQKVIEQIESLEDEYFNSLLDRQTQEENAVANKYFNLIEQAKKFGQDTAILEEAQQAALAEIKNRYAEQERLQMQASLEEQTKYALALAEADEQIAQAKRNALNVGLESLRAFAGENKALSVAILGVQKALAIAEIITNAKKGIAASLVNWQSVPPFIGTFPNPAYVKAGILHGKHVAMTKITAGASIASILAQSITSIKGAGGLGGNAGTGGAGSIGGAGTPPPAFNVVGTSGMNQIAEQLSQEQQPVQAFVVGSNVTTQQELDRNIVTTASLG